MTAQTFHLTIALGTEQMRSGDDVHRALSLVGADLANRYDGLTLPEHLAGVIRDKSGAEIGAWGTEQRETAEEIADRFASVGHALDWEDGPKRRAYIIQAVKIARGEVEA